MSDSDSSLEKIKHRKMAQFMPDMIDLRAVDVGKSPYPWKD